MSEPPAQLRYGATAGFLRIIDTRRCSLTISVYMSGRVIPVRRRNYLLAAMRNASIVLL